MMRKKRTRFELTINKMDGVENLKRKLPLLLVAVSVVGEYLYRDYLTEKTLRDVPLMQQNERPKALMVLVSDAAIEVMPAFFCAFSFGVLDKQ